MFLVGMSLSVPLTPCTLSAARTTFSVCRQKRDVPAAIDCNSEPNVAKRQALESARIAVTEHLNNRLCAKENGLSSEFLILCCLLQLLCHDLFFWGVLEYPRYHRAKGTQSSESLG